MPTIEPAGRSASLWYVDPVFITTTSRLSSRFSMGPSVHVEGMSVGTSEIKGQPNPAVRESSTVTLQRVDYEINLAHNQKLFQLFRPQVLRGEFLQSNDLVPIACCFLG